MQGRNNNTPDNRNNNIGFRVALHFQSEMLMRPGIAWFTDPASVVMKVLAVFLSRDGV